MSAMALGSWRLPLDWWPAAPVVGVVVAWMVPSRSKLPSNRDRRLLLCGRPACLGELGWLSGWWLLWDYWPAALVVGLVVS